MNKTIPTKNPDVTIRFAVESDVTTILDFIRGLAEYEKLTHEVVVDENILRDSLFGIRRVSEILIAEFQGKAAGFALFFHNYSTFLGKPGIYLEDLFVKPEFRSKGIGKLLLTYLVKLASERGCGRVEWSVLDWNEPAIKFYKSLGAKPMDEWTVFRVTGDDLKNLADQF